MQKKKKKTWKWLIFALYRVLFGQGKLMGTMVDPLQVPDGPITRSRAKNIKEAMKKLVQSTWAEFANLLSKTPTFNMGLKEEEPALIHVIQATDGGGIA